MQRDDTRISERFERQRDAGGGGVAVLLLLLLG